MSIDRPVRKMKRHKSISPHCQILHATLFAVFILFRSILVASGQNTGTAVQLNNVDIVESVEASNKARIESELQHEEEARKHAQSVVRLAATDQLNSEILTNRTRAYLSCESGEMIVKINFTEPFRGVGYSDYDRTSPCKFYGDGGRYYELRLPLKGCGTKQEAPRIFINNIILRFHRSLELEEDEIKTIICRYPPPLAPPPPLIAAPILEQPPVPAPFMPAHLSEVELILIVSALLFLTLLLLGIGMGYYCLKRRNIKVVRKVPPPFIPPIPRASLSSSETFYESDYDDMYRTDHNLIEEDYTVTGQNVIVPPLPLFQHQMLDDRYVTSGLHTDIDEDVEIGRFIVPKRPKITALITDQYYVTPTHTTEIVDEIITQRLFVPPEKPLTARRIEDTFVTPMESTEVIENVTQQRAFGPPVLTTHMTDDLFIHPEEDTEVIEEHTTHRLYRPKEQRPQIETVDDYFLHPEDETEITEEIVNQRIMGPPKTPQPLTKTEEDYFRDVYEIDEFEDDSVTGRMYAPQPTTRIVQTSDDEYVTHAREVEEFVDDSSHRLMPPPHKPKIVVKTVDDFFVTNIQETETTENVIKTGRSMPNLLLTPDTDDEEEEDIHQVTTVNKTGFDITLRSIPLRPSEPVQTTASTTDIHTSTSKTTKESFKYEKVLHVIDNPPPNHRIDNFDELFPPPKREKLRTVIITDEVFRTIIIESTTIEEYSERIIRHPTYGPLFEPPTWEVIFRLLSLPEVVDFDKDFPTRKPLGSTRSYVSGFSSAHEVRSVTEEDVNFTRRRITSAHFVPPPDYPIDEEPLSVPSGPHWASRLPDPKRYETPHYAPITPAFATTGRRPRQRLPDSVYSTTSSVFAGRHLANPYLPYSSASPSVRRRLLEQGRPYSPDLDALSLEPTTPLRSHGASYMAYSASVGQTVQQSQQQRQSQLQHTSRLTADEHEEIKSTTETDVYDWKRYS